MNPITYAAADSYPIAILIKESSFNAQAIDANYVMPLVKRGIDEDNFIAYPLIYNDKGKAPVSHIKEQLTLMLSDLLDQRVKYLYCADAAFFKRLSGLHKADPNLGYCLPCVFEGYEDMKVILGVNHTSLIYNPLNENKLALSLKAVDAIFHAQPTQFDTPFLDDVRYPRTLLDIDQCLKSLHQYPVLAVDIETFGLDHDKAGIGSIAFAWTSTDGIGFAVDYEPLPHPNRVYGERKYNAEKRRMLREFFTAYKGQLCFHRANFDIKILIYELYMGSLDDTEGLLQGLEIFTRDFDDTRIIAYLALNSCAGNELSLKALAQEYAGNYAQEDIKDITLIPLPELLEYNVVDACCTNWVHDKHYPTLMADDQEGTYFDIMLPSLKTIIQMELTGMPLNPQRVQRVRHELEIIRTKHQLLIRNDPLIKETEENMKMAAWKKDFQMRVAKAVNPDKIKEKDYDTFPTKPFNPASPKQMQELLYSVLDLPIIETTKTGQPATGADVIETLSKHVRVDTTKQLFKSLIGFAKADKVLTTFIVAFEKAIKHNPDDPRVYLHGSFNLGGTVSGRLSSSDPNLQNIPANSVYGTLVKSCFQANDTELFVGADFNSLEAMVNALTTKDPNKLIIYENGLDSHSWNAFVYWPHEMPDIAARMALADQPGAFYKTEQPDGSFIYQHESEL